MNGGKDLGAKMARFSQDGEWYQAAHMAGAINNFLGLKFGPNTGELPTFQVERIGDEKAVIEADEVLSQVLEGVSEANIYFGTEFHVTAIRFVSSDTRSSDRYRLLTLFIVRQLVERGITIPTTSH